MIHSVMFADKNLAFRNSSSIAMQLTVRLHVGLYILQTEEQEF